MMHLTIRDVEVALQAAIDNPAAQAVYCNKLTLRDMGRHAMFALEKRPGWTLRTAQAFMFDAAEAEVAEKVGGGFAAAHELLLLFIQQAVAERTCPTCGTERGRDCFVVTQDGRKIGQRWIHDERALAAAVVQ